MLYRRCPTVRIDAAWRPAEALAAIPAACVHEGRALLGEVLDEFPTGSTVAADLARLRTGGRFQAELRAAAAHLGIGWRALMLANISYDLTLLALGCSTAALATPHGPVLARNLDWWPERALARATLAIEVRDGDRLVRAVAGWPGFSGVITGLSGRGFALALNAVASPERPALTGYPVLLFLRRVLDDARDFEHALDLIASTRLAASCLITLVGVGNAQRVCIERSPRRAALRWPDGDAPLVTTNDYRLLYAEQTGTAPADLGATACGRFDALTVLTEALGGRAVDDETLLAALTDREVIQGITVQHVIMRPATGLARVWVPSRFLDD